MYNFQGSFEHAVIPIRFVFIVLRAITYVKVKWLQQLPQTFVAKTTGYNLLSWSWPLARPVWIHCSFYIRQSIVYLRCQHKRWGQLERYFSKVQGGFKRTQDLYHVVYICPKTTEWYYCYSLRKHFIHWYNMSL